MLVRRGHAVTVVTGTPNYPDGSVFPEFAAGPTAFGYLDGVEIVRVPLRSRRRGGLNLALNYLSFAVSATVFGTWRLRGRCFDAVFVFQTSPATVGLPAAWLAKVKRAPMLFWVLDCWPESLVGVGAVRPKSAVGRATLWLVGVMMRFIYSRSTLILGQSRSFATSVARYGDVARFRYFPNWVEATHAFVERSTPASDGPVFTVMFAGNIGVAQDFPAIIDAVEDLRSSPVRWLIVGDGREAEAVRSAIVARGLESNFQMLGRYPSDAMPALFAKADALLVSLRNDPLFAMTVPGKLQSYLAAGKPVLAMLDGEGADTVIAAGAGLVSPAGDGKALAGQVRVMMGLMPFERAAMALAGQEFAATHYNSDRVIDQLEVWLHDSVTSSFRRKGN